LYKTLFFRYSEQGNETETVKLLQSGVVVMLKHGQFNCASELSLLLFDYFKSNKIAVIQKYIDLVKELFSLYPPEKEVKNSFAKAVFRWLAAIGIKEDSPINREFHGIFGESFGNDKEYALALKHLVRSTRPKVLLEMIIQWSSITRLSHPTEIDLYFVRPILLCLCVGNTVGSTVLLDYIDAENKKVEKLANTKADDGEPSPLDTPLIHFAFFIFSAIQKKDYNLFHALTTKYSPSVSRDPEFPSYVDRIGQVFFGVSSNQSGFGFFGDLMRSFLTDTPTTTSTSATTPTLTHNEDVD